MSKTNNLGDFLKDVADGIRTVEGSTGAIAAQDFRTRIENLTPTTTEAVFSSNFTVGTSGGLQIVSTAGNVATSKQLTALNIPNGTTFTETNRGTLTVSTPTSGQGNVTVKASDNVAHDVIVNGSYNGPVTTDATWVNVTDGAGSGLQLISVAGQTPVKYISELKVPSSTCLPNIKNSGVIGSLYDVSGTTINDTGKGYYVDYSTASERTLYTKTQTNKIDYATATSISWTTVSSGCITNTPGVMTQEELSTDTDGTPNPMLKLWYYRPGGNIYKLTNGSLAQISTILNEDALNTRLSTYDEKSVGKIGVITNKGKIDSIYNNSTGGFAKIDNIFNGTGGTIGGISNSTTISNITNSGNINLLTNTGSLSVENDGTSTTNSTYVRHNTSDAGYLSVKAYDESDYTTIVSAGNWTNRVYRRFYTGKCVTNDWRPGFYVYGVMTTSGSKIDNGTASSRWSGYYEIFSFSGSAIKAIYTADGRKVGSTPLPYATIRQIIWTKPTAYVRNSSDSDKADKGNCNLYIALNSGTYYILKDSSTDQGGGSAGTISSSILLKQLVNDDPGNTQIAPDSKLLIQWTTAHTTDGTIALTNCSGGSGSGMSDSYQYVTNIVRTTTRATQGMQQEYVISRADISYSTTYSYLSQLDYLDIIATNSSGGYSAKLYYSPITGERTAY